MRDNIIKVESLGKKYSLAHKGQSRDGLRHVLENALSAPWRTLKRRFGNADTLKDRPVVSANSTEDFWALKDVSFEVKRGEVLGIIGRNGAGKSTLLKILSRITEPTVGRVEIDGRVASLLEVGTGFHPELTGRENIFLNGTILGMKRAEIWAKFDEIIAFAEVERFLDTPVKRYSSGMYVRLAFAVAAHLEPEILIIDEVLAVGDSQFQQKCLGKIGAVARGGRTVLFVSHSMATVGKLCSNVVLLDGGQVIDRGEPTPVIARYLGEGMSRVCGDGELNIKAAEHPFILVAVEVLNVDGNRSSLLANHQPFRVRLVYDLTTPMRQLRVGFRLHAQDTTVVLSSTNCDALGGEIPGCLTGRYVSEVEFPGHLLNRGRYYLWVGVDIPMVCAVLSVDQATSFSIETVGGMTADINDARLGVVAPLLPWTTKAVG